MKRYLRLFNYITSRAVDITDFYTSSVTNGKVTFQGEFSQAKLDKYSTLLKAKPQTEFNGGYIIINLRSPTIEITLTK